MATNSVSLDPDHVFAPVRRGFLADFFVRLFREKHLGAVGGIIFLLLLLTGIFASVLAPPLTVTKDQIDFAMEVFDRALQIADAEAKG